MAWITRRVASISGQRRVRPARREVQNLSRVLEAEHRPAATLLAPAIRRPLGEQTFGAQHSVRIAEVAPWEGSRLEEQPCLHARDEPEPGVRVRMEPQPLAVPCNTAAPSV